MILLQGSVSGQWLAIINVLDRDCGPKSFELFSMIQWAGIRWLANLPHTGIVEAQIVLR
jgi:hypothetical protein